MNTNYTMPQEETKLGLEFWKDLLTIILTISAPICAFVYGLFSWLNKRTEAQTKRDREFVQTVVKEVMDSALSGIQRDVQEMKRDTHDNLHQMNKRIDDVYKEVRK